jgi:hypothetical protein
MAGDLRRLESDLEAASLEVDLLDHRADLELDLEGRAAACDEPESPD